MTPLRFDPLTEADMPMAAALSIEAGWNQIPGDWRRLLALAPRGCLAGRLDGNLVATATRVDYSETTGWIGMVLVRKAHRGRGFGTAMLERVIGAGPCGLDATELGRPLYRKLGFADVVPIDRWVGTLRRGPPGRVQPLRDHFQAAMAFDRQACGVDRAELLGHLAGEPDVRQWVALDGDRIVGLASLRRGREHWHLGPITCADPSVLDRLLAAAAEELGHHTVLVDAIRDDARSSVLAARGLQVQRRLMRMTRPGGQGMLMGPQVAAATAFEWG